MHWLKYMYIYIYLSIIVCFNLQNSFAKLSLLLLLSCKHVKHTYMLVYVFVRCIIHTPVFLEKYYNSKVLCF